MLTDKDRVLVVQLFVLCLQCRDLVLFHFQLVCLPLVVFGQTVVAGDGESEEFQLLLLELRLQGCTLTVTGLVDVDVDVLVSIIVLVVVLVVVVVVVLVAVVISVAGVCTYNSRLFHGTGCRSVLDSDG